MNSTRAARPIPIALTALIAFFSALAALAVSNGMDMAQAHGNTPHQARASMTMNVHPTATLSAKSVALQWLGACNVALRRLMNSGSPAAIDCALARIVRSA